MFLNGDISLILRDISSPKNIKFLLEEKFEGTYTRDEGEILKSFIKKAERILLKEKSGKDIWISIYNQITIKLPMFFIKFAIENELEINISVND